MRPGQRQRHNLHHPAPHPGLRSRQPRQTWNACSNSSKPGYPCPWGHPKTAAASSTSATWLISFSPPSPTPRPAIRPSSCSERARPLHPRTNRLIGPLRPTALSPCALPLPLLRLSGKLGDSMQQITHRTLPLNTDTPDRLTGSLSVDISHLQTQLHCGPPLTVEQGLENPFLTSGRQGKTAKILAYIYPPSGTASRISFYANGAFSARARVCVTIAGLV